MGTTSRGYRYPEPTDFVKDGAQAIEDLATDINTDVAGLTAAWSSYTPALTATTSSPTLGTGSTAEGYYKQVGKLVVWQARLVFGTGAAAGTGSYRVSLPVTGVTRTAMVFGQGVLWDDSASTAALTVCRFVSTTTVEMWIGSATEIVTEANPWAWAQNDYIVLSGTYEAA